MKDKIIRKLKWEASDNDDVFLVKELEKLESPQTEDKILESFSKEHSICGNDVCRKRWIKTCKDLIEMERQKTRASCKPECLNHKEGRMITCNICVDELIKKAREEVVKPLESKLDISLKNCQKLYKRAVDNYVKFSKVNLQLASFKKKIDEQYIEEGCECESCKLVRELKNSLEGSE